MFTLVHALLLQQMSFFSKVGDSLNKAGASAKKAATQLKLKAQIDLKNADIKSYKKAMGIVVFDAMVRGDSDSAMTAFRDHQYLVLEAEASIVRKRKILEDLESGKMSEEDINALDNEASSKGSLGTGRQHAQAL